MDERARHRLLVDFGARVRELRVHAGLSQEALALQAGLDRSYVGQVERGERNITLINIHKLARAISRDASDLVQPPKQRVGT
jgi:transcriptional regulator with XRE-family HTH domain